MYITELMKSLSVKCQYISSIFQKYVLNSCEVHLKCFTASTLFSGCCFASFHVFFVAESLPKRRPTCQSYFFLTFLFLCPNKSQMTCNIQLIPSCELACLECRITNHVQIKGMDQRTYSTQKSYIFFCCCLNGIKKKIGYACILFPPCCHCV